MTRPENLPSPCISVCRMNELTGLCEGCWRSIDEIARWGNADAEDRRTILLRIEQRRQTGQA
ncbi:MAG: DUF1289 domain-containing protein [Rhodoferax sp.]